MKNIIINSEYYNNKYQYLFSKELWCWLLSFLSVSKSYVIFSCSIIKSQELVRKMKNTIFSELLYYEILDELVLFWWCICFEACQKERHMFNSLFHWSRHGQLFWDGESNLNSFIVIRARQVYSMYKLYQWS